MPARILSHQALSVKGRTRLPYRARPGWIPPMLATVTEWAPAGAGWVFEPKLHGSRVLAYVAGGAVRVFSRDHKSVGSAYPELVEALSKAVRGDAVLDGEIVTGVSVELYLFDCLFYEGIDLTGLPLLDRKKVLRDVVWYEAPIRLTPYRGAGSVTMYREACAKGAGGIIAKRAESRYVSGRSAEWLEIKRERQQKFVTDRQ